MSMPLRNIIAAVFGLAAGAVLLFTGWADDVLPPPLDQYRHLLGVVPVLASVFAGAQGILHERRMGAETARLRGAYPELADVPVERLKKHLLFIAYFRQTPDPLPVRADFDEHDVRLGQKSRDDLAQFDRVLEQIRDLSEEEKRMCRMRYIAEELLS